MGLLNAPTPGVKPGDVLAGKYRVERILGRGGMGVVVAAHHLQLDEKVALKFLLPGSFGDAEAVRRLLREARAAAKIKSEHVARVTDVGQLDDGAPYMVMEYLEGSDLASWLQQHGALHTGQAVAFVLQACEALADAHARGIVHRDLKPANLFRVERPDGQISIKVLDFGLSKAPLAEAPGNTTTTTTSSSFWGSPPYMSPEQMRPLESIDSRTDIWSLGVILFELVAARRPFTGAGMPELAIKIATEPATSLRVLVPEVPIGLEQAVAKCLEKDRTSRFQDVAELALALETFGSEGSRDSVDRVLGTLRRPHRRGDTNVAPGETERSPAWRATTQTGVEAASEGMAGSAPTGAGHSSRTRIGGMVGLGLLAIALASTFALWPRAARTPTVSVNVAETRTSGAPAPTTPTAPSGTSEKSEPSSQTAALPYPSASAAVIGPRAPRPSTRPSTEGGTAKPARGPMPSASAAEKPAPSGTPSSNCNPPWFMDSTGHHKYKLECL